MELAKKIQQLFKDFPAPKSTILRTKNRMVCYGIVEFNIPLDTV